MGTGIGNCNSNGGKMSNSLEVLRNRVQDALYEWYAVPLVLETRVDKLPGIDAKFRAWFDHLENAVNDLQDELESQARWATEPLRPCPSCGSSEVGRMCTFMKPSEQHIRCFACGTTFDPHFSLKPCPFCGGEVKLTGSQAVIRCQECYTLFSFSSGFDDGTPDVNRYWNTRANSL